MTSVRENWRIVLLVVLVVASTVALFAPVAGSSDGPGGGAVAGDSPTNLQYGLELSGGTRIRAPLVGVTAAEVEYGDVETPEAEREVAGRLGDVSVADVIVRPTSETSGTVEVTAGGVTPAELGRALDAAGYDLSLDAEPARCGSCNGEVSPVDADAPLPAYAPDPADTDCWRCRECKQVFWKGGHWDDVRTTLDSV